MENTQSSQIKFNYPKSFWGFVFAIAFLPIFLSLWIWRQKWDIKLRIGLITAMWSLGLFGYITNSIYNFGYQAGKQINPKADSITSSPASIPATPTLINTPIPTPTVTPTQVKVISSPSPADVVSSVTPEVIPTSLSPYEVLSKIGKEVAGNSSNVSVFKNDDGSVDVINNIQLNPEITWGLDSYTRRWVTDFLSKSYTSGLKIRYVLVTVSFLNMGIPATRAGLGINRAKIYTPNEWKEFTPYDLCNWLKGIQVGDDVDPGDPDFDPSNWAFAKNYKCS